ncbi:MAG TPA: hypothetical protein VLC98_12790 [Phnomibacter sp.]|nr:hypothetical protein [Phnomibacter sp.]
MKNLTLLGCLAGILVTAFSACKSPEPAPETLGGGIPQAVENRLHYLYFKRGDLKSKSQPNKDMTMYFSHQIKLNGSISVSGWVQGNGNGSEFTEDPQIITEVGIDSMALPGDTYVGDFKLSKKDVKKILDKKYDSYNYVVFRPDISAKKGFISWQVGVSIDAPIKELANQFSFESIDIIVNPIPPGNINDEELPGTP